MKNRRKIKFERNSINLFFKIKFKYEKDKRNC